MRLEDLPAARNRDQVILLIAEFDDEMQKLGILLYQVTQRRPQPSLLHYLERNVEDIANVSKEVAAAKTAAEAAAAELRRKHVLERSEALELIILDDAQRRLKIGIVKADGTSDRPGFAAIGKRKLGGDFEVVPPEHWELGVPDWSTMKLALPSDVWFALRVVNMSDLSREEAAVLMAPQSPPPPQSGPGARSSPDRNVSHAKLNAFLQKHVAESPPRTSSEKNLWSAARKHFAPQSVSRAAVRDWMKESLPAEERLRPGQKSDDWRFGEHKKKA